ncbi:hypothetical protein [Paracoccus aminovorans]|uniref:hypothetical protein n=1 Tax=Paracoccus aminovorans TaxID=34004 RepID=UPI002B25749C|nr:hypothetical protein [Paracoccus aminovorans]
MRTISVDFRARQRRVEISRVNSIPEEQCPSHWPPNRLLTVLVERDAALVRIADLEMRPAFAVEA